MSYGKVPDLEQLRAMFRDRVKEQGLDPGKWAGAIDEFALATDDMRSEFKEMVSRLTIKTDEHDPTLLHFSIPAEIVEQLHGVDFSREWFLDEPCGEPLWSLGRPRDMRDHYLAERVHCRASMTSWCVRLMLSREGQRR